MSIRPKLTVALPVYNSASIVWLALQSLVNQRGIDFEWELIVMEENKGDVYGEEELEKWTESLRNNGCCRIIYCALDEWIPLSQKWVKMGELAAPSSKAFLLQAADCYSYPYRLSHTMMAFRMAANGYDWFQTEMGLFYDVNLDKSIMYDQRTTSHPTALNMAFKTKYIKQLGESIGTDIEWPKKGIDYWLFTNFSLIKGGGLKIYRIKPGTHLKWKGGVDTNGLNNISLARVNKFIEVKPPFVHSEYLIDDFIPAEVMTRLREAGKLNRERRESMKNMSLVKH